MEKEEGEIMKKRGRERKGGREKEQIILDGKQWNEMYLSSIRVCDSEITKRNNR